MKAFEEKIEPKYKKYRHDNISISVKSEIAVKGLYSNIVPYIKQDDDESLYPTSGEGRKKLLVYSIFDLLSQDEEDKKINIFLIEEPENHLHRSMQIALSHTLFVDDKYQYLFMTTHSPHVLSEMDKVNLIRLYNENKTVSSSSALYVVPNKFKSQRKMLNRGLVEAIFADKVLLVEGPSENVLFGKILSVINPFYEADGIYILPVGGFGFRPYFDMLKALRIKTIIKTDNDLRKIKGKEKYSVLGFLRLNNYLDRKILSEEPIDENSVEAKRKLYADNQEELDEIRNQYSLYLSRCSLEEDLDEVIHNQMVIYLTEANNDPIGYLQEKKNYHMVELVEKLTDDDCRCIYNHYNFACLREVMK
nr:TOPRIM nucleotidyl transferase/hydrolase domain-containing protein [Catenibacterium mitsuokai]